jgi:hypothetical protein
VTVIVLLNGAFGIGKSTIARRMAARLPRSIVLNPEPIGVVLQRAGRMVGMTIDDFQDLALWRRLTVLAVRTARIIRPNVIVPMAFSNSAYLREIRSALSVLDGRVIHFCLVAPVEVVHARLRFRGAHPRRNEWEYRRASECCAAHVAPEFFRQVPAAGREPDAIAEELIAALFSKAER